MVTLLKKYMMNLTFKPKVKESVQLYFLQRLHRLLTNGYPLIRALEIMQWDKQLRPYAEEMKELLVKGKPIDEALHELHFHRLIVTYLYFVRFNGSLIDNIATCITLFSQRMTYMKKFFRVLRYPFFLSICFFVLLFFLKRSILPSFVQLFVTTSSTSSTSLTFSILFIDIFTTFALLSASVLILLLFVWSFYKKNVPLEEQLHIYAKIPIVRRMIQLITSFYFATHTGMFLQAGVSLKDSLHHLSEQKKLPIVAYYAALMRENLASGLSIHHLLVELPFIERQLANVFEKHHNMKTLAKDLLAYSEYMTDYIERIVMRMITFIQPTFFVVLASFIIFIYLSLMLPMFELIKTI